ncbi:MAG: hypothetical protein KBS74_01775 [Clostridiales bacterium]|nr:hypothetical protein [Candidatus Cacconaster stercorequi]
MKKVFFLTITVLLLMMQITVPVFGAEIDMNYEGEIDSFTGTPIHESSSEMVAAERVSVDENTYYDRTNGAFVYTTANGAEILSTAASGMVTTNAVQITVPTGVATELYRDGKVVDTPNLSNISEPGSYVLIVNNSGQVAQKIQFTIVNSVTGALNEYIMPDGFSVTQVMRGDESVSSGASKVDLSEEGTYTITYTCQATDISYQLNITVDHTPPKLALEAVVNDVAKGPVDISDLEQGATISIQLDGEKIAYTDQLTRSGSYVITVQDEAGNANTYKFVIQVYLNISSLAFFAVTSAVVIGVIVYLIYKRKHLRTR